MKTDEYFEYHMKHLIAYMDEQKRKKIEKRNKKQLEKYHQDKKDKEKADAINERCRLNYHRRKAKHLSEHEEVIILREENELLKQTVADLEKELMNERYKL